MNRYLKTVIFWLTDMLPGAAICALVYKGGLLMTAAGYVLEVLIVLYRRKCMQCKRGDSLHNWTMGIISSVGIVAGSILYPVPSSPEALGIAAIVLTLAVHAALYGILVACSGKDQRLRSKGSAES